MSTLIAFLLTLCGASRQAEANALRQTAPTYLESDLVAAAHLAGSTYAGDAFSVDPAVLLAIAYRESRYTLGVVGREVRGRRACGLMQPMMHDDTCRKQTVVEGYLEGASHLRTWLDTKTCRGDLHCALLGYGGGYALIRGCAAGPVVVERNGKRADLCKFIPGSVTARAAWIRNRLARAAGAS
jgi:hypothetical protein